MNKNKNLPAGAKLQELARNNAVPIMFIIICAVFIPMAGFTPGYLVNEIITRMGRNLFLVLCLLFPIMAGMGMNFAMTLGAMGAELAIILVAANLGHPRRGAGDDSVHPLFRDSGPGVRHHSEHGQGP